MRYYKLNQGIQEIFEIEKNSFELNTKMKEPYYQKNKNDEMVQYAVCPACDNPIEIIGLYKKLKNTNKPYGKHYPKTINRVAIYNQQAYEFCPYSSQKIQISKDCRKELLTDFERNIYTLMKENFDIVVYILSKVLDIKITRVLAEEMLKTYISSKSWQYPWATLNNLPYMFGYLYPAQSLYGKLILKDSNLYNTLKKKFKEIIFKQSKYYKNYEILEVKEGSFLDLEYSLILHNRKIQDNKLIETLKLSVSLGHPLKENLKEVYSKEIIIDEPYFLNLVKKQENEKYRNKNLLEIANKLMLPI
mgnify:CR=1 FL=1